MSEFVGKTIGHNQIVEEIGRGGMAVVYKAYQPSIDRYVAIKVMSRHLARDASFAQRFQHEAKAIAGLEHPHILPLYDFGTTDGQMYMVMRYIEGGTVEGLVGQPLAYSRIGQIVGDIAKALDYAHRQGVIHRDIKPSNILVDKNGSVLLADFGIAKLVKGSQLTIPGAALGTLTYMAPEQAKGHVDQRSDIYSLGLVLYELLTGRSLAQGSKNLAEMLLHTIEPPPPPREIKPDIPPVLERVVLKAIAQEPAQRYQSGAEMERALQAALAEIEARPETVTGSKSKMRPLFVGGLILSLLFCLGGAGLIGWAVYGWTQGQESASPTRPAVARASPTAIQTEVMPAAAASPSPVPTATPLRSQSETLPLPGAGENLLEERFTSNQRDWFTGVSEDEYGQATLEMVDGRYRFGQEAKQGVFSWQELEGPSFDDFELTIDAYPITHTAAVAYGVVFRSDGAGNFYTFEIDSDGYFVVSISRDDGWETLIDYSEMPAIRADFNQLGVRAVGSNLSFFVNGQKVATVEDDSYRRGAIGVAVELYNEGDKATVEFDNLIVRAVEADEAAAATDDDILFVERFDSDANGWATGEFEDDFNWDSVTIADGTYSFAVVSKQDTVYVEKTLPRLEFSDFVLTVEAVPQNTDTFYSYGVAFRQNKMSHTYAFEIGNDGLYGFLLFDGQWHKLKDWSSTDAINVGETNRIKIIARGNQFTFFVNGQQLTTVEDDTLSSGKVSLAIHTFEAGKRAAVNFDNLVIRTVEPGR